MEEKKLEAKEILENPDKHEIISDFELHEKIGSGAFSSVYIAKHIITGTWVAAKVVDLSRLQEHEFNGIMREISVFMQVEHPYICSCYRLSVVGQSLVFFIEYAPGGTLLNYVNVRGGLTEADAHKVFLQIFEAIRYLHVHYFLVHRDLKLENILLDKNGNVKVTDFGLASTSYCNLMRSYVGTPGYTAPEVLAGSDYDERCDVWSLGVCLYAMLTANLPFSQTNNFRKLVEEAENLKFPMNFTPALVDLLKRMLHVRPQSRCRLSDIQNHPWLRGIPSFPTNISPTPIVFYKVSCVLDILKFKRKSHKPNLEIVDKCREMYGIDSTQLTKELCDGLISSNTTIYFCMMYPLLEKPAPPEHPAAKIIPGSKHRTKGNMNGLNQQRKIGASSPTVQQKGVYKKAAQLVIGQIPKNVPKRPLYTKPPL